ncbi:MAG: hypothetical protein Q9224_006779, partial [Gallowayella concinna]
FHGHAFFKDGTFLRNPYTLTNLFSYHEFNSGDYSLGSRLRSHFRMGSSTREDVHNFRLNHARDPDSYGTGSTSLAIVYFYVAPCFRLLSQAIGVAWEVITAEFFQVRIRVDDRLDVSCCRPTGTAQSRLASVLRMVRKAYKSAGYLKTVDQLWLEQRLYHLEAEEPFLQLPTIDRIKHIYNEDEYSQLEVVGSIVLFGEEEQMREIMASESFPRHPRVPVAPEIYAMQSSYGDSFTRYYLGGYDRNPKLAARQGSTGSPSEANLVKDEWAVTDEYEEPSAKRSRLSGQHSATSSKLDPCNA